MIAFTLFDFIVLIIMVALLALTGSDNEIPAPQPASAERHAAPHFQRPPGCGAETSTPVPAL